ncbi:MAG: DUF427 domain-containing protein [Candidatus Competibacterales bacterium]
MVEPVTLVPNPIQRPDEPRHFMVLKPLAHPVTAAVAGQTIASSRAALRLQEAGRDLYDPVVYFPLDAIPEGLLQPTAKTTHCPLKGDTVYYDVVVGERRLAAAAWRYVTVCDFDPRLEILKDRVAFDATKIQVTELTAE